MVFVKNFREDKEGKVEVHCPLSEGSLCDKSKSAHAFGAQYN
jgi:hypothetical protein